MDAFLKNTEKLTRYLYIVGGVCLIFIMSLTISDVFLRLMRQTHRRNL